jgi:acylphosphatase
MLVSRRYLITGRVQGVGFRYFAEVAAAREGLHGWVMNRSDGGVEIEVEGDAESVERFERQVRHGPPRARVERVELEEAAPTGRASGFSIR